MNTPLVSVIIPTYCRSESLGRALESLTQQTFGSFEVVIVDDNTDDEWSAAVRETVAAYSGRLNTVYLRNTAVHGSAGSRNLGIENAKGEYVTFLDDDDLYMPGKIENQLNDMIQKQADYSITDLELFNEQGHMIDRRKRDYIKKYDAESLYRYHLMYHMTGTDTLMFKKDYLIAAGCFPPKDSGDEFYLMCLAIRKNGKLAYYPACDVHAFVHNTSGLSAGEGKIKGENELYLYKKNHFPELDFQTKSIIRMRHFAVLAYAYKRSRRYGRFFLNGVRSFFANPVYSIRLILKRK